MTIQEPNNISIALNGQMVNSAQAIDICIRLTGTTVKLQGVMMSDQEHLWLLDLWKSGVPIEVAIYTHELTFNAKMRKFDKQTAQQKVGEMPTWTAEIVEIEKDA